MTKQLPGAFLDENDIKIKLDSKDRKIISALSVNAKLSPTYIGKVVGLSKDSVRYRIKKMVFV